MRFGHWMMAVAMLAALGVMGCEGERTGVDYPAPQEAWESLTVDDSDVVASVDGVGITKNEVLRLWKKKPRWSAEEAVEAAVERRLLADEAHRRGLSARPEVAFSQKQGLVAGLLKEKVEAEARGSETRRQELAAEMAQRRRSPAGFRASHLAVMVDEEVAEQEGLDTAGLLAEGESILRAIRDEDLDDRASDDALREQARRLNEQVLPAGLEAVVNVHLRFPQPDEQYFAEGLPEGWISVVPEFAQAAQATVDTQGFGMLSEPVETSFGWHVMRVEEAMEARPALAEDVDRLAAIRADEEVRRRQLRTLLEPLGEAADFRIFPERLQVDAGER